LDDLLAGPNGSTITLLFIALVRTAGFSVGPLVILVVVLGLSFLFNSAGHAIFSLSPGRIRDMRVSGDPGEHRIVRMLERPEHLSAALWLLAIIFYVALVLIWGDILIRIPSLAAKKGWLALVLFVPSILVILFFGEILPRIIASRYPLMVATWMAWPLTAACRLLYPLTSLIVRSGAYADFTIFRKNQEDDTNELTEALEISPDEITPEEEKKILKGIVKFGDIEVKEIMRIRMDVVAVEESVRFGELVRIVTSSGYSRIPVYKDSFDNVTGILYVKDLLPHLVHSDDFNWLTLIRIPLFVPENKPINDLLKEFQRKKNHMAIVVDEYGGTSGIVTLEDIIEEIVGEISDEYDTEGDEVTWNRIDDRTWMFEGKTSLNDFCKILETDDTVFDEVKGDAESLAGLVLELVGKIPHKGENVSWGDFVFHIESVDTRRIKKVKVMIHPADEEE
jgi:gliding motility-associated protein GldE